MEKENGFRLMPIQDLKDRRFVIPSYQRGYRWGVQQVIDLLNDINEIDKNDSMHEYCLQPLVVKTTEILRVPVEKCKLEDKKVQRWYLILKSDIEDVSTSFEVIDGQQRLTTIFIILKYLLQNKENFSYSISYDTRKNSEDYLSKSLFTVEKQSDENDNIDFYHMHQCYETVKNWFDGKDKEDFLKKLMTKVYFIWYEDESADSAATFTRLNINKIALTNAELIKALLLKKSNFNTSNEAFRLKQLEMANQWDEIEFTLQKDEFWYFIHPQRWKKPTRIDFIFELIMEMNLLQFDGKDLGNDNYKTFRYFYQYMEPKYDKELQADPHENIWNELRKVFQIFCEWFNDATIYHYIGFLASRNITLKDYISEWKKTNKDEFKIYLKEQIKNLILKLKLSDLTKRNDKRDWLPLLLLFNIQTAINQNNGYSNQSNNKVFYKFPFQLFHKENWDIEHVDSATENNLNKTEEQIGWLKMAYLGLKDKIGDEIKKEILNFIKEKEPKTETFDSLCQRICEFFPADPIQQKDSIGNFVLLDEHTNRGYGNAIFPAKRVTIIGKDQGMEYEINDSLEIKGKPAQKNFVPPCTRNVFMKYYTPNSTDIMTWSQADADAYTKQMYETLKDFGIQNPIKDSQTEEK